MSGLDLFGGMMMNRFWENRKGQSDVDAWRKYAQSLQKRLDKATEKAFFKDAEFEANSLVLKLVLDALEKADPSSPLLDKATRDMLRRQYIAATLSAQGYKFDITTGAVESKIR